MSASRTVMALAVLVLGLTPLSCTKPEIEQAFGPVMGAPESKKIIVDYCGSCHQHKLFDPDAHTARVKAKYDDPAFSGPAECRVCHTYSADFLGDVKRGTHWPPKKGP